MTPIEKCNKQIFDADRIADNAKFTGADFKKLLKEIARLEYLTSTLEDHIVNRLKHEVPRL